MKLDNGRDKILNDINSATSEAISPTGCLYVDTAVKNYTAVNGNFFAFTALEDTVLDASKSTWNIQLRDTGLGSGVDGPTVKNTTADITVPKGLTIYANIQMLTLVSGKGLLYSKAMTTTEAEG